MSNKPKLSKKSVKPSTKISRKTAISKSFAIYYLDKNKNIKYVRFRTVRNKDDSIKIILTFVDNFKNASKFINTDSAKKHIQIIQPKYTSYNFKYIDSTKV